MKGTDAAIMNYLFAWEMMRRLGFTPDEIYMTVVPPGGRVQETANHLPMHYMQPVIGLEVRLADGKSFKWVIGPTSVPLDDIEGEYERAIVAWNAGTLEGTSQEDFERSLPMQRSVEVVQVLQNKGMLPRC